MSNGLISLALQRQQERPDIHKPVAKVKQGSSFGDAVPAMVRDLKEHVPGLSIRQLSTLIGVSTKVIFKNLPAADHDDQPEHWSTDNNESQAYAELGALTATGCSGYTDQTDFASPSLVDGAEPDIDEPVTGIPQFLTAPAFSDTHRRADQSHTVKRPITLATTPFNVAA